MAKSTILIAKRRILLNPCIYSAFLYCLILPEWILGRIKKR